MRNKTLFVVSLSCLLLLAASLWACTPAAPTVATPVAPAPVADTPAADTPAADITVGDDWTRVQASGVLRVGCPLDNPPFNMYDADFQPDGFDVDLITEAAQRLGLKAEFSNFAFDGLLGALQLGRIDAVVAAMAVTDERQALADFTHSYYQGEDVILAAANSPITAIAGRADIAQRRVGVQRGTVYESWLLRNMINTGEMRATNLQAYSQPADAVAALSQGGIDLVIMDREPGLQQAAQGKAKVVGKSLYVQDYAIALRKGSALTPHMNQALAKVQADGTLARLAERYLQFPPSLFTPVPPPVEPTEAPPPTAAPTDAPAVATPTPAPTSTPAPIDDMAWVDDLSYDDSGGPPAVKPGQALEKGWRIRNSGTTTWSADYRFVYASGNTPVSNMGGMPLAIGQAITPGQELDVYVDLIAPQAPGVYQGFWQMKNAAGKAFGEKVWIKVQVPAPPTAVPAAGISFTADRYQITAGESTWLRWNVTGGVQNVWLCTPLGGACKGVAWQGQEEVRPAATTTYALRVQQSDGRTQDAPLTIKVAQAVNAPVIVTFSADRSTLHAGECLNVWWKVQGAASRIAFVRGGTPLRDYALAEENYVDCPPGSGQVVYELQVWGPGGSGPDKRQVGITVEGALPPQTLQLGQEACGSSQNLRPGDYLIVTIQGAGGTGYAWEQVGGNPSVLTPMGPVAVQEGGGMGAPVTYQWTYRAGGGETTLTLVWHRPSEGGAPPADTCNITVRVQ